MSGPRVIGAGLGRTATNSLKLALERLLGGRCYHMFELTPRPEDLPAWELALDGDASAAAATLAGWTASVDWPGCAVWAELAEAYPDALVLLSTRESPAQWWASAARTIFSSIDRHDRAEPAWPRRRALLLRLFERNLGADWRIQTSAIAGYERHNAAVRAAVAPARLIDWRAGDGWEPICAALGLAVPADPFPNENSATGFWGNIGLEPR